MQTCIILLTLRPDALRLVLLRLSTEWLGPHFAALHDMTLMERADEFGVTTPLVLLLAPGVDAVGAVAQLAGQKGAAAIVRTVSLGQGYTAVGGGAALFARWGAPAV